MELEFYRRNSLFRFVDIDRNNLIESPTDLPNINTNHEVCDDEDLQFGPSLSSSPHTTTMLTLMPPPSPESPWTLSPHQTPSPSLLYHCIASLYRREGSISSIAVSKQQGVVFTGSESTRVRVWRQPDHIEYGCLNATSGEVRAIATHGNMLFTSHKDHKIRMWNFTVTDHNFKSKKVSSLPKTSSFPLFSRFTNTKQQHKECISCLAYYKTDGLLTLLYTGSHDRTVKAWRLITNHCVDSFVAYEDNVNAMVVNQDDGCVFTCSSDGSVKLWRRVFRGNSHTLTMTLKSQFPNSNYPVKARALNTSSNSCFLYSGSADGTISFWEKEKLTHRFNHGGFLQGHHFSVLCLVAIEKLIFSGSEDTTIRVWRREEGGCFHECLAVLEGHIHKQ
ncbi:protein JINGUBANG-like [Rosa rugosa]|uniref:protein JINGUBANG-like n=1 Tax=Rosa rugosa TaxID=74645 RepID=UPI002B403881|nr:protein JINGUBANG-like [Rosa rugosa]